MSALFPPCTPLTRTSSRGPRAAAWRFVLPLALAAGLGGCSSSFRWVKEGYSPLLAEAKFASCQLEAERLQYSSAESDDERAARVRHESHLCMKADGWQKAALDEQVAGERSGDRVTLVVAERTPERPTEPPADPVSKKSSDKAEAKKDAAPSAPAPADDGEDDSEE